MKIFLDTNIFLDFYNSNEDKLAILSSLKNHLSSLVFPVQVYNEYTRNRIALLDGLIESLKKNFRFPNIPSYPILREIDDFKEFKNLKKQYDEYFSTIVRKIEEMKVDYSKDFVFTLIQEIYHSIHVTKIPYSVEIIEKARRRQLLGNPPRNTKKTNIFSACDEIIWESILATVKDDLVIVSRDATYHDNINFLSAEYTALVGKRLIRITKTINEAVSLIGGSVPQDIMDLEKQQLDEIERYPRIIRMPIIFPKPGHLSDDYKLCLNCMSYTTFNGTRCNNCGHHSED